MDDDQQQLQQQNGKQQQTKEKKPTMVRSLRRICNASTTKMVALMFESVEEAEKAQKIAALFD